MSTVETNECSEALWIHCPSDILMLIFKRLDIKSLINCINVSKSWSETVHYYVQHNNLWRKMLEVCLNKKGKMYEEKSDLNEEDLFLSVSHWLNIQDPTISPHNEYEVEKNRSIRVSKGTLNVHSYKAFTSFNIKTNDMIHKCEKKYVDYVETSSLIAELTNPRSEGNWYKLVLTNKLHYNICKCTEIQKRIPFDIILIKVQVNACYAIDIKNVLWVFKVHECRWSCNSLGRYYGNNDSISILHVHGDDVYILLKTRDVLKVNSKCRQLEKIWHIPPYFDRPSFMFQEHSVIIQMANHKIYDMFKPQREKKKLVVGFPGVTCSLEHGPVLIIGRENGKIDIFVIENLYNSGPKPACTFYLQSYVKAHSFKIISMDVYEGTDGHHLFIATEDYIYELLIT